MKHPTTKDAGLHHIVIVGGGAGGLELASMLGKSLGKKGKARITLIDKNRTHIWKPKLHEIAAGSMDTGQHEVDYLAQSHWKHFRYRVGEMTGLDRDNKQIYLAPHIDSEGKEVTREGHFSYDTLIISVGSRTNDFGIKGVEEYAIRLDTPDQAKRFHQRWINACIRAHVQEEPLRPGQLDVAIIGAGATGVELAAELRYATRQLVSYGLNSIDPDKDIGIHLIEAESRILPALPEHLAVSAAQIMNKLGITLHTNTRVNEVTASSVELAGTAAIASGLTVWAAGVRAPAFLKDLGGLETNGTNQLRVKPNLQTTRDANIFAIGDCAACPWPEKGENKFIPPRAQAAHQQAVHLAKQMNKHLAGEPVADWKYTDFGSLVSLGESSATGGLMGNLSRSTFFINGYFARLMYNSLYKSHQLTLHGAWKVTLETLANMLRGRGQPKIKLH